MVNKSVSIAPKRSPLVDAVNGLLLFLCLAGSSISDTIADDHLNLEPHMQNAHKSANEAIDFEVAQHIGRTSRDILILEGDSWFDLPSTHYDLADALWERRYAVLSVAQHGDTLENMAFNGQLSEIAMQFRKSAQYGKYPTAILLSAGGNDIIASNFAFLMNHSESTVRNQSTTGGIDLRWQQTILNAALRRFQSYVMDYIASISLLCEGIEERGEYRELKMKCEKIPIIIHGYDFPVSSGKGFSSLFIFRAGPWIKPSFDVKGYGDSDAKMLLKHFVGAYNVHLRDVVEVLNDSGKFKNPICYLCLLGTVGEENWVDELHPNKSGMDAIAGKMSMAIRNCGG